MISCAYGGSGGGFQPDCIFPWKPETTNRFLQDTPWTFQFRWNWDESSRENDLVLAIFVACTLQQWIELVTFDVPVGGFWSLNAGNAPITSSQTRRRLPLRSAWAFKISRTFGTVSTAGSGDLILKQWQSQIKNTSTRSFITSGSKKRCPNLPLLGLYSFSIFQAQGEGGLLWLSSPLRNSHLALKCVLSPFRW